MHIHFKPLLIRLLMVAMSYFLWSVSYALTPVDTRIVNQASASFKDAEGVSHTVTSNVVETVIQQVAALSLVQNQSKFVSSDGDVYFPHVLTNTGNGEDRYDLLLQDIGGDFNFSSVQLFEDADQNGLPDDLNTPISESISLKQDESYSIVVLAHAPSGLNEGDSAQLTLTATSQFDNSQTAMNTDTAEVSERAIIDVSKAISSHAGVSPSGTYTVTLSYVNRGLQTATDVNLIDALPTGVSYELSSGRWSETGDATILTDIDGDAQGTNPDTIEYCAYSGGCATEVNILIAQVESGARGSVSFEVNIDAGLSAQTLVNIANYSYNDGVAVTAEKDSNQVEFEVIQSVDVVANGSNSSSTNGVSEPIEVASVSQGGVVEFRDYVWNLGNGEDTFDIVLDAVADSFPSGTVFQLYRADGFSPLTDSNGNGIVDTAPIAAGDYAEVMIKAVLPANVSAGNVGYEVTLTAISVLDDQVSDNALNRLLAITANAVDLTNNAAIGEPNVLGVGTTLSASPITINDANPTSTTRFTLYVNNISNLDDNYDLAVSTDSSFANLSLPAAWKVRFLNGAGNEISNTGNIAPSSSMLVYAEVDIPADQAVGQYSLYFRVRSPNTGASDIKHDAVNVTEVKDLIIEPNNQGQVLPGGSIVYSHFVINQGNLAQTDVQLSTTNNQEKWNAVLFDDTDGNGTFSNDDLPIAETDLLTLAAGESRLIFTKVYAPATAPMGLSNVTVVMATWNAGVDRTQAEDVTTTNRSDIMVEKRQAFDSNCDGNAETNFSFDNFSVDPGECVLYELTAINTGAESMFNIKIQDATPAFTTFITAGGSLPQLSQGNELTAISHGSTGNIIGLMGQIDPGETAVMIFGIKID